MDYGAFILSRIQFAFTISFHIIFSAFTIRLAAWLAFFEGASLFTKRPVYRWLFDLWLRIVAVAFGLGVVSGIVMEIQFGTNWSELARRSGSIQGGLLAYESLSAFALEAAFFGILMFGRKRVPPVIYFAACVMISLGTNLSAYWILANNSWMQHPTGYSVGTDGVFTPVDWGEILFNYVTVIRYVHMAFAAYVTTAFCVIATGAMYLLQRRDQDEARTMLTMGLWLAAVLVPLQLGAGHLVGGYVVKNQPSKISALEGRWHSAKPAGEVLIGWPDPAHERNLFEIKLPPPIGSIIDSMSLSAKEIGIADIPKAERPNVFIVFFTFRLMVGLGLWMLAIAWGGTLLGLFKRLDRSRWFLWPAFLSFPVVFLATLIGWFTAEVGRQPWVIFGHLKTIDAITPGLTTTPVSFTLILFAVIYAFIFLFGTYFIYRMAVRPERAEADRRDQRQAPAAVALGGCLALYVLLDGFDLGIGILFAFAPNERGRRHMMESVAPVWDGNETWLVIAAGVLFGALPLANSILVSHDGPEAYVHEFEHDLAHPSEGHHDTRADDRHEHKQAAAASDDTHAHSIFLPSSLEEVEARVERARPARPHAGGTSGPAAAGRFSTLRGSYAEHPGVLMLGAMLVAQVYAIFHDAHRRRSVRLRWSQGAST